MDVFMRNIEYKQTQLDLKIVFEEVLHNPPFLSSLEPPFNFFITLFPSKTPFQNHGGCGILSVPTRAIGLKFLELYGGNQPPRPITLGGRRLGFAVSKSPVDKDLIQRLQQTPYVSSRSIIESEAHRRQIRSEMVMITQIQYGWE